MHELSLAVEVLRLLEAQAPALSRITDVTLTLGALGCVDEAALRTALAHALRGSLADGARIHTLREEAVSECLDCGQTSTPTARTEPCPHCGSARRHWRSGQALQLTRIEGLAHPGAG
ncbi:MAG: hydrogenase maturation nickel metallochaperone HypA [Proteobacteria bacterium]|uniref:hydrogenase maturation nickel metallochaperone HypA n=1 Tax=Aquabacterium sp. TaxID=1872578 RepID=UPI0035C67351|nr:hydrogenase maturation nickel metallochaperone HypA [Pseudomonadota bacterium]